MAIRPLFLPDTDPTTRGSYKIIDIEFTWFPGYAVSQKQKSIRSLHNNAKSDVVKDILEISSKSENMIGIKLSAFNLLISEHKNGQIPLECAFQGSKVFEHSGPFKDLLSTSPYLIKKDMRLKESGLITSFNFNGEMFENSPMTFFYNWLYINALHEDILLSKEVLKYDGFTDIEFNPKKSKNCQAKACSLYVSLVKKNEIDACLNDRNYFKRIVSQLEKQNSCEKSSKQFEIKFS
jgi:hypothetical protein